jgi:hypothetical protein
LAELCIAVLLLPARTAWWAAVSALALLAVFSGGIAINLARGHAPACNCFGGYSTRPISAGNLWRNAIFGALGLPVIAPGYGSAQLDAMGWASSVLGIRPAGVIVVGVMGMLLVGQAIFLGQLFMQHGRLLVRLDELTTGGDAGAVAPPPEYPPIPVGEPAPAFALPTLDGGAASPESLRADGQPVVLIFAETTCSACADMLPDVGRWQREFAGIVAVAVVSSTRDRGMRRAARRHQVGAVLLQTGHETAFSYHVRATPAAIAIGADGRIASTPALGRDAIHRLLRQTAATGRPAKSTHETDTMRLIPSSADARRTRGSAS